MNHRNIEDFQRALINLKGFNHNRDLTVSGELDEATNKSITEVISHMKRHLIDSIKDDPYNIVIISEWLIQFGYGSLIKDLYAQCRRVFQRMAFIAGAASVSALWNCDVTKEALLHSLKENPGSISWGNSSNAAKLFKNSKEFTSLVNDEMKKHKKDILLQKSFSGKIEFRPDSSDRDLHYTFGKITVEYKAEHHFFDTWKLKFHAEDKYDFDNYRILDEIFEKGLREIDFKFSNFVNDIGLLAQKDKVIIPYKITVDFDYEVDVSKL